MKRDSHIEFLKDKRLTTSLKQIFLTYIILVAILLQIYLEGVFKVHALIQLECLLAILTSGNFLKFYFIENVLSLL